MNIIFHTMDLDFFIFNRLKKICRQHLNCTFQLNFDTELFLNSNDFLTVSDEST